MNKKVKGILNINCKYVGAAEGIWVGKAIVFEDNSILGVAYDSLADEFSHVLAGNFVPKCGITVIKFNKNKFRYDPISFTATANNSGKENFYYGGYTAVTPIQEYAIGGNVMKITTNDMKQNVIDYILEQVRIYQAKVSQEDMFQSDLFGNVINADSRDVESNIRHIHAMNCDEEISSDLLDDSEIENEIL